jgi:hypothetical protein
MAKISFFLRIINNASTKSGSILVLFSVISFFAMLNNRSQLACDAGMAKYFLAKEADKLEKEKKNFEKTDMTYLE